MKNRKDDNNFVVGKSATNIPDGMQRFVIYGYWYTYFINFVNKLVFVQVKNVHKGSAPSLRQQLCDACGKLCDELGRGHDLHRPDVHFNNFGESRLYPQFASFVNTSVPASCSEGT